MLSLILQTIPQGRKVKCLEFGSGRGGLTLFISKELMKLDKLALMVGSNISEKENESHRARAKEEGIPDELYRVDHGSFDDMPYKDGEFDLVFCNDSFLHSSDKAKLMKKLTEILADDGALVFTDILESPTVNRAELQDVYDRLSLPNLGDKITYNRVLTENGM